MGQLEELMAYRQSVESNIEKSFGTGFDLNDEFEKARSGVYKDTAENRRLKRVGQKYGSSAAPDQGGAKPQGKKAEEGGQKPEGKADSGKLANYASGASDEALKRAAADKNAAPEVKAAAQAELKKRGGGKENSSKEMSEREKDMRTWSDNHLQDILNDEDGYTDEDRQVAKDELEKRSGFNKKMEKVKAKFSNMIGDKKYFPNEGAIDAYLNYVRQSPEVAYKYDSENPELAELIEAATKEMGIKLPPREEVINQRKEQEERKRKEFEEYKKKERKKMEEDPIYAVEHSVSLEWGEPEGRKGKALMKDVKNAAKNFLKKNPDLELTIEDWEAIAEGEPDELEDFSSLEGYQELSDAIDAYVDR